MGERRRRVIIVPDSASEPDWLDVAGRVVRPIVPRLSFGETVEKVFAVNPLAPKSLVCIDLVAAVAHVLPTGAEVMGADVPVCHLEPDGAPQSARDARWSDVGEGGGDAGTNCRNVVNGRIMARKPVISYPAMVDYLVDALATAQQLGYSGPAHLVIDMDGGRPKLFLGGEPELEGLRYSIAVGGGQQFFRRAPWGLIS